MADLRKACRDYAGTGVQVTAREEKRQGRFFLLSAVTSRELSIMGAVPMFW